MNQNYISRNQKKWIESIEINDSKEKWQLINVIISIDWNINVNILGPTIFEQYAPIFIYALIHAFDIDVD